MTITSPELHRLADDIGVSLRRHSGGIPGWYDHETRVISTRRGMSIAMYKSVLAHELAHAYYEDTPSPVGHFTLRQEMRANRAAGELLIAPGAFRDAMIWHHHHLGAVADELEVTRHLLGIWISGNERKIAA